MPSRLRHCSFPAILPRGLGLCLLVSLLASCGKPAASKSAAPVPVAMASGPLPQSIYLWQRVWSPAVVAAVAETARPEVAELVPLALEVAWKRDGTMQKVEPNLNFPALLALGKPIGLAFRIDPWSGPFSETDERCQGLCTAAQGIVAKARAAGVMPVELQIDFDAATSKLHGYRTWVRALRRSVSPLPVVFTALPDWLRSPELRAMAEETGGFVLQVHAVEKPTLLHAAEPRLVDVAKARRWVQEAAGLGVPFRVALSSYRYQVAYAADGKILGIGAEGPRKQWPAGTLLRDHISHPVELAGLVAEWTQQRPAMLRGLHWYRLPVAGDERNWRWPTLAAVMQGRSPQEASGGVCRGENPVDLVWKNTGEADAMVPPNIRLTLTGGKIVAGDGLHGYDFRSDGARPQEAVFSRKPQETANPALPPGGSVILGWVRLDQPLLSYEITLVH